VPAFGVPQYFDQQMPDLDHDLRFAIVFLAYSIGPQIAEAGEVVFRDLLRKAAFESLCYLDPVIAVRGRVRIAFLAENRQCLVILPAERVDPQLFRRPGSLCSCQDLRVIDLPFVPCAELSDGLVFVIRLLIVGVGELQI